MKKFKVHFLGGEGINWALDHDILHLSRLSSDFVDVVSLEKAEIVHSVFWGAILEVPEKHLKNKTVIASIADKPQIVMSRPEYLKVRKKIDVWLCEYYESLNFISNCGLNCKLFPDPIDLRQFSPPANRAESIKDLKERFNIPQNSYLIGNFHRDSAMGALDRPKKQKGADVLLEVATQLHQQSMPIHFLLAGPRRHWIRENMRQRGIPFTYVGTQIDQDDIRENTLSLDEIAELYRGLDAYVISSRWEGAPNSVLECSASKTKVISTKVGQAPDILSRDQIFYNAQEGAEKIASDIEIGFLAEKTESAYEMVQKFNSDSMVAGRLKYIYQSAVRNDGSGTRGSHDTKSSSRESLFGFRKRRASASMEDSQEERKKKIRARLGAKKKLKFGLWNDFKPPPYGGGNQFMIALENSLLRKGMEVCRNAGERVDAHIIQSIWFDRKKFDQELEEGAVVIHRVDGPIQLYRGNDLKSDDLCYRINDEIADITVMQSSWSISKTYDLGFTPRNPVLMWNSCSQDTFNKVGRKEFSRENKVKLISTAWSNNTRKGKDVYHWLDQNLDFSRYEYTFVGRIEGEFANIRHIEPVPSEKLADLLRGHDIFITASQKDPCSNSLVEALACGLPAIYLNDGGHPELVEYGGVGFLDRKEIPDLLEKITSGYESYQNNIWIDHMEDIAQKYIDLVNYSYAI